MAVEHLDTERVLATFFDEGVFAALFDVRTSRAAHGLVHGQPCYAVVQSGGAVGRAELELATRTLALAAKTGNPVVVFYNAMGTKLEDGPAALKAHAAFAAASSRISGVVPQLSVVLGVCGASQALAAAGADLCILAAGAEFFLTLPQPGQTAQLPPVPGAVYAQQAGVAALVEQSAEAAVQAAARLVALLPQNNLTQPQPTAFDTPLQPLPAGARAAQDAFAALADVDSVVEVYPAFGGGMATAFATMGGATVGLVATNGPAETIDGPAADKAARFMRLCDAFSIPLVSVVDTGGFAAEEAVETPGGIRAAARLAATYADATTPKVTVITGRAIGPVYTAFCAADLTIALEGAVIAPAAPSAVVTVLYREEILASGETVEEATRRRVHRYETEVASAGAALAAGLADMVATTATLRTRVLQALDILLSKREQRLAKKHGNMPL